MRVTPRTSLRALLYLSALAAALPASAGDRAVKTGDVRMIPVEGEGAKYWPRFRGPSGQGNVPDGPYPDKWSETENVLWKVEVPGRGNSSPVIWKDRVFLTSSFDGGKKRAILCLDRGDGKLLWEAPAPAAKPESAYGKNGWATPSVATDGERAITYFGNAGVLCVDFAGKQLWHESFGPIDTLHGTACTPLLYKDKVILYQNQRPKAGGGFVVALDKHTGKQVWKTPRKETVGWGSPVAITVDGKDQIIVSSEFTVYAYDPDDGKVIWTCGGNTVEVIPLPVVAHNLLFCCSGRAGPTLAINPSGAKGDVTKTHVVWRATKGSPFVCAPLVYGEQLYMVNDLVSVVTCYEARTGKLLWQERCGQPIKEGFSSSPVGLNGKVFMTNELGETYVLANGPEFKLHHVNALGEKTLASPALVDGRWYWRTEKHLWCIGTKR